MKDELTFMSCGHVAQGTDAEGNPVCVICYPDPASVTIKNHPDIEGRVARCQLCGHKKPSNFNLPFFAYDKYDDFDTYYCGCRGWN